MRPFDLRSFTLFGTNKMNPNFDEVTLPPSRRTQEQSPAIPPDSGIEQPASSLPVGSLNRNYLAERRLPIGAEVFPDAGVHFRVWAPSCKTVEVVLESGNGKGPFPHPLPIALAPEDNGYFSGIVTEVETGLLYSLMLDGKGPFADPASRFQPQGPHGPSKVIDPQAFPWRDAEWKGVSPEGQVIYEMHVGTFTAEGTWKAATRALKVLSDLGITVIELMPVADFPGRFGWGYDGVNLFAPTRLYGNPDDFRQFVDQAHQLGIGVILDVVYNHFGPDGNHLKQYAESYFTDRYKNDWGEPINFDGPDAGPVREFFLANVRYWIEEFHVDGYRFDATQQIFDSSSDNIMAAMTREARQAARGKSILTVAENEPQDTRLVRSPDDGGYGMDSLWNDDFHHSAMVALTGRTDAYYSDYRGDPQEFISALKWGYLYQGQHYAWQKARRGTPSLDLPPTAFVNYFQNHDQIANSGSGERGHKVTSPGRYRTMTALLLLGPQTPMLFQGQEFAASNPFFYFADHTPDLVQQVAQGRAEFLAQFRNLATPEMQARLPNPGDPETFMRCKLNLTDRLEPGHAKAFALHQDLIRLRRDDPVFRRPRVRGMDGAVLGAEAFVLRYFGEHGDDRLLVVNLGRHLHLNPSPEPLLAPPSGMAWEVLWSSENPLYGGEGTPPLETEDNWQIPGEAAVVMRPVKEKE